MNVLLQDLFLSHVERRPQAMALVGTHSQMTYEQLELTSNRIAHLFRDAGCRSGDRICLMLSKTPLAIACVLGALKSECIYVPVDAGAPSARALRIVQVARPSVIVFDDTSRDLLLELTSDQDCPRGIACVGLTPGLISTQTMSVADSLHFSERRPPSTTTTNAIAHILFTSASSGIPKGVGVTHKNVISFVDWATRYFGYSCHDRNSGHSPLDFDLSTLDIFGTLFAGAELHLVDRKLNLDPARLAQWIDKSALTQWFSVPSILSLLLQRGALENYSFKELRRLLWCGEVLPTPTLVGLMERLPHVRFTNLYGPTETTIASSYYTVPQKPVTAAAIPIGKACEGEELLLFDEDGLLIEQGSGEIHIGGSGVTTGYWDQPELTEAAFVRDVRAGKPDGARLYKTGDIGRIGNDGMLHFIGRSDTQVKRLGYRIELGEIECAILSTEGVSECAVVALPDQSYGSIICCAFAPVTEAPASIASLRAWLSKQIPSYMIPTQWMMFGELPKTPNGKLNKKVLKQVFTERSAQKAAPSIPG